MWTQGQRLRISTDGGRDTASPKVMGSVGCGINTNGTEGSLDDVVGCLGTKGLARFFEV
jgi:hypothetical protein